MFKIIGIMIFSLGIGYGDTLPSDSLYHVESVWKDQHAKDFKLIENKGSSVIITMLYTSCPHACPMIVSKVTDIEKELKKNKIKNYKIVLASFDSKNDNPEQLKKFAIKRKLDLSKWTLITTEDESVVRELAVLLNISYKPVGKGDFSHSNVITVLNTKGQITTQIDKLSADITPLVEALKLQNNK